jgi:two-component system, NarL family, nitrate/nitrite response regulator NarL
MTNKTDERLDRANRNARMTVEPSSRIPIRVFILAEKHLYSRALAQFLGGHEMLTVIGMDEDIGRALRRLEDLKPDVVLLDTEIANSAVAVCRIAEVEPGIKVVALAVPWDERDLVACAKARVAGYVSPEEDPEDLVVTIEGVARGEMRCSPRIAHALLDRVAALATHGAPDPIDISLTTRELQVLRLIDRGQSNKEIARQLSIELPTVKNHVHNILGKMKVNRRTEAIARLRR